jgi:hypothetical protein
LINSLSRLTDPSNLEKSDEEIVEFYEDFYQQSESAECESVEGTSSQCEDTNVSDSVIYNI